MVEPLKPPMQSMEPVQSLLNVRVLSIEMPRVCREAWVVVEVVEPPLNPHNASKSCPDGERTRSYTTDLDLRG